MKKKLLLILPIIICMCPLTQAQTTIPNGGFELWEDQDTPEEEPTEWNGNKTGGGFASLGPQTCFRENSGVHSGSYCLKLKNGSILGTAVNASVTTGRIEVPSLDASEGYIHTITGESDFNSTFTGRPDSLVGWYKFSQGGSDVGRIQAILHEDFNVTEPALGDSEAFTVGQATYDVTSGSSSIWTRFSIPFTYNNGNTPSHILLIAMASTSVGNANTNTTMWVDDLSVVYSTVGLLENEVKAELLTYPNPTDGDVTVDLGDFHKSVTVTISASDGTLIQSEEFKDTQQLNLTVKAPAGVYVLTVTSEKSKVVMRLIKKT